MRLLPGGLLLALVLPAHALTPGEIATGAAEAGNGTRTVVRRLAGNSLRGRDNGTPESLKAQTYLIRKLKRLGAGLDGTQTGDAAYRQPFTFGTQQGTNLLAVIPGRELPNEYVIVGGHYDHLDSRSTPDGHCSAGGTPGGAICNGATDNAAGVAAVLGVGSAIRKLPTPPRRSVVLALWDAEEDGLVGSLYYTAHPLAPLASTVAYVNFDIQGANLLPSLHTTSFAVSSETGGPAFQSLVAQAIAAEALDTHELSYIFGQLRSDYASFVAKSVPSVFFTDATGGCYHTTGDDVGLVDFKKLATQSRIAFRTTVDLAETATPPTFVPPNPALAVYADAVGVSGILQAGIADQALFSPADQTLLQTIAAQLQAIVDSGSGAFDSADVATLLGAAVNTLGALARVGCHKF